MTYWINPESNVALLKGNWQVFKMAALLQRANKAQRKIKTKKNERKNKY